MTPEVIVVFGRGLAVVLERGAVDEALADRMGRLAGEDPLGRPWVRFGDHGPLPGKLGNWTWSDRTRALSAEEAVEAVLRERAEATARGMDCTTRDCWCRKVAP